MTQKDNKHWSHQSEASHDEVKDALSDGIEWVLVHRKEATYAAGGTAAAVIVAIFLFYSHRARVNDAWDKLSQAEVFAYSGRPTEAQSLIKQVTEGGASPAATTLARMFEGDMIYPSGKFDEAAAAYDKAIESAPDALRPYATADKVMTLEAAGKFADCATIAQAFLEANPDHLLAAQVHTVLARCQVALGQSEAAQSTLQRISLQYRDTPWAQWANERLQTLAKK